MVLFNHIAPHYWVHHYPCKVQVILFYSLGENMPTYTQKHRRSSAVLHFHLRPFLFVCLPFRGLSLCKQLPLPLWSWKPGIHLKSSVQSPAVIRNCKKWPNFPVWQPLLWFHFPLKRLSFLLLSSRRWLWENSSGSHRFKGIYCCFTLCDSSRSKQ